MQINIYETKKNQFRIVCEARDFNVDACATYNVHKNPMQIGGRHQIFSNLDVDHIKCLKMETVDLHISCLWI